MIFINSLFSQFEVTNLIGIFAPIFGKINIILTNLALYTNCFSFSLAISFFIVFILFFVDILPGSRFNIHNSIRKFIDTVVKTEGTIGTGIVGVVTGLDSALNLANRMKKKEGGSSGSGSDENDPDKDKDKNKKKKTKQKIKKVMIKILKKYLNFLFNFSFFLFLYYVIIRDLVYFFFKQLQNVISEKSIKMNYFLPIIWANFSSTITSETEPLIRYSFSMFFLSLLVLICFFNILGYLLSIYLINKYDIEKKFPYLKRYIKFYSSTSKILLGLEVLIAFFFLICIVVINFFLFTSILLI